MERWKPPVETSKKEDMLLARAKRSRKLFAFLRLHRHVLFDDAFQSELEALYRDSGAGSEPVPPAMLCMALIVQGYLGTSDAEAVELTVVDARWQMVLDRIGSDEPAFAQGTLQRFRERLIANDMDKRLLERTIELARHARDFDWKKLPKSLRVAVDSRPLAGAGRVEDTFNLLGHAGRKLIALVAKERGTSAAEICTAARTPLLQGSSTKAALDIDWNDVEQKEDAFDALALQVAGLVDWLEIQKLAEDEPLRPYLNALLDVWAQDVEVEGDHRLRIRQGVAPDRRITKAAPGRGRAVQIATDEHLQKKLRRLTTTPGGRSRLRERTVVEHSLAHVAARKGPRARYRGTRRNLFDLRRASTIQNLETLHRVTTRVEQVQKAA